MFAPTGPAELKENLGLGRTQAWEVTLGTPGGGGRAGIKPKTQEARGDPEGWGFRPVTTADLLGPKWAGKMLVTFSYDPPVPRRSLSVLLIARHE